MEKTTLLPGKPNVGNLFSFFAKKKAGLMGKFVPGWTDNKIDALLFTPKTADIKPVRLPRGIDQFVIKTRDGEIPLVP